jgi:glucan phosphoethanolaminetransferase (alkaline phosphatase superfamily)
MRPGAIVKFERLYLISLALVLVQQVIAFFFMRDMFNTFGGAMGDAGEAGFISAIMVFAMLFGLVLAAGIPLIFWWLAARKRQEFAKWVLLVLSVLSALNWLLSVVMLFLLPAGSMDMAVGSGFQGFQAALVAVDALAEILGIAALVYLFRPEANAWFRGLSSAASADIFR